MKLATRRWLYHRSTAVALLPQTAWRSDWMPKSPLVASTSENMPSPPASPASDFRTCAPLHSHTPSHAQPKLDSMTDRHQGLARSRPYWPLSARGSCCRSPQRICGDRPRAGGRRGRRARGMPKGTSCHALLPPRLLTDLQRAVYVSGMVRYDAGIERAEGKVHLSHVGVDHPDGLEKTPATTPLDPSVSAPWPASSRTQTTSRRGGRTDSRSAPQPD